MTCAQAHDLVRYWNRRYAHGGTSGAGSEGTAAVHKAMWVNRLIRAQQVQSIVDWGCGDGAVAILLTGASYVGVDVSTRALQRCRQRMPKRRFIRPSEAEGLRADLALSLDVIYHLPDDDTYHRYLAQVFGSAERFVAVHAADHDDGPPAPHLCWRRWTPDIPDGWQLVSRPPDDGRIGFYLCQRIDT